jgi:hypothetical protein
VALFDACARAKYLLTTVTLYAEKPIPSFSWMAGIGQDCSSLPRAARKDCAQRCTSWVIT